MKAQEKNAEMMKSILGGRFEGGRLYLLMHKNMNVADRVLTEVTFPTLTLRGVEYEKPLILVHHKEYINYENTIEELTKMEQLSSIVALVIRNLNVHYLSNNGSELAELSHIAKLHSIPVIVYYKLDMINDILAMDTINFSSRVTESCDFVASFDVPKDVIECHVMKNRQSKDKPEGIVKFTYIDI